MTKEELLSPYYMENATLVAEIEMFHLSNKGRTIFRKNWECIMYRPKLFRGHKTPIVLVTDGKYSSLWKPKVMMSNLLKQNAINWVTNYKKTLYSM